MRNVREVCLLVLMLGFGFELVAQTLAPSVMDRSWSRTTPRGRFGTIEGVAMLGDTVYAALVEQMMMGTVRQKVMLDRHILGDESVKRVDVELKYKKKKLRFEKMMAWGNEVVLFSSFFNKAQEKTFLFAQRLDIQRLKFESKPQLLGEVNSKTWLGEGYFGFGFSPDSSKLLVYAGDATKNAENSTLSLYVYDTSLELIWKKDVKLPYKTNDFEVQNYRVGNDGSVHLLGLFDEGMLRWGRPKQPDYEYVLLSYTRDGSEYKRSSLKGFDRFITNLAMRITPTNKVVIAGYYSEENRKDVRGVCYFEYDPNTETMSAPLYTAFDFALRSKDLNYRGRLRAEKAEQQGATSQQVELINYSLDRMLLGPDGGIYLIGEQTYTTTYTNFNGGGFNNNMMRTVTIYHTDDLIISALNNKGELTWAGSVSKQQDGQSTQQLSYGCLLLQDRIWLLHDNLAPGSLFNRSTNQQALVVNELATYDGNSLSGPFDKTGMLANSDVVPRALKQLDAHTGLITEYNKKDYRLIVFRF